MKPRAKLQAEVIPKYPAYLLEVSDSRFGLDFPGRKHGEFDSQVFLLLTESLLNKYKLIDAQHLLLKCYISEQIIGR